MQSMACRPTTHGYEESRFETHVDENFHCSICLNVVKEPRMCRNNEHVFCLSCISEHLNVNHQNCPECGDRLSVDTLRRPRLIINYLSKLKIKCDFASRGCPEFTCVENLESHVDNCGFAPVLCSNEECGKEINKRDRVYHESEVCEYRKVKCHDCEQIQELVGEMEATLEELDEKMEATNEKMKDSLLELDEKLEVIENRMQSNHNDMHQNVEQVKNEVGQVKNEVGQVKNEVGQVKNEVRQVKNEVGQVKNEVGQVKNEVRQVKNEVEQVKNKVEQVKNDIKVVKENISKVSQDVNEVKIMMAEVLEKLKVLELRNTTLARVSPQNTAKQDILIAGGNDSSDSIGKSAEIYSWEKNAWFELFPMNENHDGAASFVYEDQLFIVGGVGSSGIETLNLSELPLKWTKFPGELPYLCDHHQTVVCQNHVILIGGYNHDQGQRSCLISELKLTVPCVLKELCQMPKARDCHCAEIFDDKILILGGEESEDSNNAMDSVLEFDIKKNDCTKKPSLPNALTEMATVHWNDKVLIFGGRNDENEILNDVFMYNFKTGETTPLPSMLEKRYACCAVITGDTVVVMGGENDESEVLNSVECFTVGDYKWKYLPGMNNARCSAVAQALPSTRKYV